MVAIVLFYLVVANLVPFSEALPNTLLWAWLGVLAMPYTSELRLPAYAQPPAAATVGRSRDLTPAYAQIMGNIEAEPG